MKKLMLLVAVAISTVGFSQDVEVPNFKIKSSSHRTEILTDYVKVDSTWFAVDSINLLVNQLTYKLYGYDSATTGYLSYDYKEIKKTIDLTKRYESFTFDIDNMKFVKQTLFKREVGVIDYVIGMNGDYEGQYYISVINKEGYERAYYVDNKAQTVSHTVSFTNQDVPDDVIVLRMEKVFTSNKFIVKPRKN